MAARKYIHRYQTDEEVLDAAKSIMESKLVMRDLLTSPDLVRNYLRAHLGSEQREIFSALFLDNQNRLIASEDLFYGTIDSAAVYPREVVKAVLKHNAAALILAHNHPSGVESPSEADKRITSRLQAALQLIDVRVIDHLIVGGSNTYSFAEHGIL